MVYSSDFPWGIRIDEDIKKFKAAAEKEEQGKGEKPAAKPPAWMTYHAAGLDQRPDLSVGTGADRQLLSPPASNWYARTGAPEQAKEPTLAFSSTTAYGPQARREPIRDATTCCR